MNSSPKWFEAIQVNAKSLGFLEVGAVDLSQDILTSYQKQAQFYQTWISDGHHGGMEYLKRGLEKKQDVRALFPETKSVLCFLYPYSAEPIGDGVLGPKFARYTRGGDYHELLRGKLNEVMAQVSLADFRYKITVDTSPVLERTWAYLAGLGWIGKNTMLIHPKHGSYTFIACVLINQETGLKPSPMKDYCGNCVRCLERCPTKAFVEPKKLDARKCISSLTLEERGEWNVAPEIKQQMGTWVAGCDICQEVCPFNHKIQKKVKNQLGETTRWDFLGTLSEKDYAAWTKNKAINRIRYGDFSRNIANANENRFKSD